MDTFVRDLIDQAFQLANTDPRRPKQANLRRSISSAYYAVFHLLVRAATRRIIGKAGGARERAGLGRAFEHSTMASICKSFSSGGALPGAGNLPSGVPAPLRRVATSFVDLQQERHVADYDLLPIIKRQRAISLIQQAEGAVDDWRRVGSTPEAKFFLVLLLAGEARQRRRAPAGA